MYLKSIRYRPSVGTRACLFRVVSIFLFFSQPSQLLLISSDLDFKHLASCVIVDGV